jgi:hypothetical protein
MPVYNTETSNDFAELLLLAGLYEEKDVKRIKEDYDVDDRERVRVNNP